MRVVSRGGTVARAVAVALTVLTTGTVLNACSDAPTVHAAGGALPAARTPPAAPTVPRTPPAVSPPTLVALGESFTAQSGSPLYNRGPCERAPGTYPDLVARRLRLTVINLACSGASSADLLTTTQPGAGGPQVTEVPGGARVVTVLIGLDDLGAAPFRFIGELSGCQAGNAAAGRQSSCRSLPGMAPSALGAAVQEAGANLATALAWLRAHRPSVRVLVLDYPAVLGARSCPADGHLVASDAVAYRAVLDQLNAVLRSAATAAHDAFVDLYTPSLGPDGCPDWLTPPTSTAVFPSHPSAAGQAAMAAVVARAVSGALVRPVDDGTP